MKKVLIIAFLLLPVAQLFSQSVSSTLSQNTIRIGEQFYFEMTITDGDDAKIVWPAIKDTLNKFIEIVDSVIQTGVNKSITSKKYLITCFDSGHFVIPSQLIMINDAEVYTQPLEFDVRTVKVDTTQDIKDIKEIKTVSYNEKSKPYGFMDWLKDYWYVAAGIGVLLAVILFLLFRNKKTIVEQEVKIILPLHQQLIADIDALLSKNYPQSGQVKLFYVELTDLLRHYTEKRFKVHALEQTTNELMLSLKSSGILIEAQEILRSILTTADMVKFAKANPTIDESIAAAQHAKRFAELTQPIEQLNHE